MVSQYGGMFGNIPPAILPNGQESLSGMRQLMQVVGAFGRSGGNGFSMSMAGLVPLPPDRLIIYGKIREEEGGGSGSGGGLGVTFTAGTDASFYDADGYLAYAFDEINPFWPWKGEILEGGIKTVLPSIGSGGGLQGGGNFAYSLNQGYIAAGALCALLRAGEHWIILGVSEEGTGSGAGGMTITCNDGLNYPVTIGETTITIGDAI